MTDSQELLYTVEDGIATVILNRPERRNALSPQLTHLLADTWQRIDADPEVRVAILTGSYCGTFCAGMDLREAARLKAETGKDILEFFADLRNEGIGKVRKPLIAAINGHFPAGGMMLALNCDLRVGLAGTRGGITEVKVGRGSPWAVPLLWMMPQAQLMETVLTGEMLPAERLHAVGFLNYLEDSDDAVQARARELARKIADAAPLSVMAGKKVLKDATTLGCESGLQAAWDYYERHVYSSEDAAEGVNSFVERREAVFKGR